MPLSKQGQKAANKGKAYEDLIKTQMVQGGVLCTEQVRLQGGALFSDTKIIDFLITNHHDFPNGLYAEVKWQGTPGTADEKIPYLVACIKQKFDKPCIIIIDGKGFRPKIIPWLETQVDDKLVQIIHGDLSQWIMDTEFK